MASGSAASLSAARRILARAVAEPKVDGQQVADELFALVDALDADLALARALTNPNRSAADKGKAVRQAMAGHLEVAVKVAAEVAGLRWSKDGDLADGLEELAFDAALASAERAKLLETIEAELFEVDAALRNHRDLRTALGDLVASSEAKAKLAEAVFKGAVRPETLYLIERLARHPRGRGIRFALGWVGKLVAERRQRLVAEVTSAVPLSANQSTNLASILSAEYGRQIQLNVIVDHAQIGGLRIRVGSDVVDGSLLTQFHKLRRDLAA